MKLNTELDLELKASLRRIEVLERNLRDAEEAGKRMAKQLVQVERERGDLIAKLAELEGQEPVAVVCDTYELRWIGCGPLAPIISRRQIKVGDSLYARPVPAEEGIVTVTTDDTGRCVMVSRQDEDHRILSVIWQAEG